MTEKDSKSLDILVVKPVDCKGLQSNRKTVEITPAKWFVVKPLALKEIP